MRASWPAVVTGIGALLVSTVAGAQVLERPEREGDPGVYARRARTDVTRPRSDLVAEVSALGGYGDDLLTRGSASIDPAALGYVYSGVASGQLRFSRASQRRSFLLGGGGFAEANERRGNMFGGGLDLQGAQTFGRRDRLNGSANVNYVPYQGLGSARSDASGVGAATSGALNPTYGSVANGSLNVVAGTNYNHGWGPSDRSEAGYSFAQNSQSEGYRTYIHTGYVQQVHRVARPTEIGASYRYGQSAVLFDGVDVPMTQQTFEGLFTYRRQLSRTRTIAVSGGAGISQLNSLDPRLQTEFTARTPSASATVNLDLVRSWSVRADYRRGFGLLPGVSNQAFASHAAFFNVGGLLARRVDLAITGNLSQGRTETADASSGSQQQVMLTTQLRVALSERSAFLASYSHYHYSVRGLIDLAPGVPTEFNRHSVRVGVSLRMPLHSPRGESRRARPAQPPVTPPESEQEDREPR